MQLINVKGLRPLTVAAGLIMANPNLMYADVDQFSNITSIVSSRNTSRYISEVDSEENIFFAAKRKFNEHLNNWNNDTIFLSSVQDIVEHNDFKAIVAMGMKAVPFILDNIDREPSNLVWALNLIYGRKITNNPNASISDACKLWIKALRH